MDTEPSGGLSSAEVCAEAGVTYRQLDHWTRVGHVTPTLTPVHAGNVAASAPGEDPATPGSGYARRWGPDEVEVVTLMGRLTAAGLSVELAAKVARGDRRIAPGVYLLITPEVTQ